jgi:DNA invertase Pin-like site-specific DNA recombinase
MHLLETAQVLDRKEVNLVSLRENTATGRCFLSMMGAIHQMERKLRADGQPLDGSPRAREERPEGGHAAMSPSCETPRARIDDAFFMNEEGVFSF